MTSKKEIQKLSEKFDLSEREKEKILRDIDKALPEKILKNMDTLN